MLTLLAKAMRIQTALLLLAFILIAGIPGCNCDEGYITSPDADVTSTEEAPAAEAVE